MAPTAEILLYARAKFASPAMAAVAVVGWALLDCPSTGKPSRRA